MKLIDQHTKKIMEGCKERARAKGLRFRDETLEYIISNRELLELSSKVMIPTLYDYWVQDVEVLKERGRYELYPGNPYETVINTHPAISFYNDNNPDWLNVMIFYHVLAHIDFFQNNHFFKHTWNYNFTEQALADNRLIEKLRSEKGRWVDYVIEFSRGIDNLVSFLSDLSASYQLCADKKEDRLNFYFDVFLQDTKKESYSEYLKELDRYNECCANCGEKDPEEEFFFQVSLKYPEFKAIFKKYLKRKKEGVDERLDILQYLIKNSPRLNRRKNRWMKSVVEIVRNTSVFFQPQIRTKIMNEGWASYWHEKLFLEDERMSSHEVDFAKVNAGVTALSRVGLNPYALGLRLYSYIEDSVNKGKNTMAYNMITDAEQRKNFNSKTGQGRDFIFKVRENLCDSMFIRYINQDFVDLHKLFVAGERINSERNTKEFFVKSRKAEDYRKMVQDSLYHPPHIKFGTKSTSKHNILVLVHRFEGLPLVSEFIDNVILGVGFLWGDQVELETTEPIDAGDGSIGWKPVKYTCTFPKRTILKKDK